jgi:hypothetical protein
MKMTEHNPNFGRLFADYVLADASAPMQEAQDELVREWQVRKRCFDRWVAEGRLSVTEARERMDRLGACLLLLREYESHLEAAKIAAAGAAV